MLTFPKIKITKKTGNEAFEVAGTDISLSLQDFWSWSSSDLTNNALRGILAEFIVASALNLNDGVRKEWDAYDLETTDGIKIEIKSASYIQSWNQKKLSPIQFNIRPTHFWNESQNSFDPNSLARQSDIYVFCLLTHKVQDSINPLNLDQWEFFVIKTEHLNRKVGEQKTITLNSLLKLCPVKSSFLGLAETIKKESR